VSRRDTWALESEGIPVENIGSPTGVRVHFGVLTGAFTLTGDLYYTTACGLLIMARDVAFDVGPTTCVRCIGVSRPRT